MQEWWLAGIALLLIGYAAVSGRLQSTVVTQAMVFVALGLLVGNRVLHLVEADTANQYVRHLAEATLALVLFTDAVRVNRHRLRREALVPARLLGIGLPLTIVAGTVAALALFAELDLWTAAALATMLAPTDAALGLPVISNRRLPSRIRQGLNVESGLNDGVCVPLLIIFLTLAAAEEGAGDLDPVLGGPGGDRLRRRRRGRRRGPRGLGAARLRGPGAGWRGPGSRSTRWRRRCWPTGSPSPSGAAGSSPPSSPGSPSGSSPASGPRRPPTWPSRAGSC